MLRILLDFFQELRYISEQSSGQILPPTIRIFIEIGHFALLPEILGLYTLSLLLMATLLFLQTASNLVISVLGLKRARVFISYQHDLEIVATK